MIGIRLLNQCLSRLQWFFSNILYRIVCNGLPPKWSSKWKSWNGGMVVLQRCEGQSRKIQVINRRMKRRTTPLKGLVVRPNRQIFSSVVQKLTYIKTDG